jgi:glycosyltransferase involved in cell wall biosynthesis
MTRGPTLSVITPSLNQGRFIERSIQSVLLQGIPDLEYVICDGGSVDETVRVLKDYGNRLQWISEPDRGQAHSVNKGISQTKGEIICWINSDDVYYPGALQAVQKVFRDNPTTLAVYGQADHIDARDNVVQPYPTEPWNYHRLMDVCFLCQPAVFFRRVLIQKLGALDETLQYCMDYELWLRYGKYNYFQYLQDRLAGSRMYSGNKTSSQPFAAHREISGMLLQKLGFVPLRWVFAYTRLSLEASGHHHGVPKHQVPSRFRYFMRLACLSFINYLAWARRVPQENSMRELLVSPLHSLLRLKTMFKTYMN